LLVGSLLLGKVEEGRGECSGGGGVDRSGQEWRRVVGKQLVGKLGRSATVAVI
nr:hypothetical protein [Tanacetum cinerariifolium]